MHLLTRFCGIGAGRALLQQFRLCRADVVAAMGASDRAPHPDTLRKLADLQLAIMATEQVVRDKQDPSFLRSFESQHRCLAMSGRVEMSHDVAFDEPVLVQVFNQPVRTVGQAAQIVRWRLREQFTMRRLSTLLMLERAADGSEVAEARRAFCSWARDELPSASGAPSGAHLL